MAEGNRIRRLTKDFKCGAEVIHDYYTRSRKRIGQGIGGHRPRKAYQFRNRSSLQTTIPLSPEIRDATRDAGSLVGYGAPYSEDQGVDATQSEPTATCKPRDEAALSAESRSVTLSSNYLSGSSFTPNTCQDWETETSLSPGFAPLDISNTCESSSLTSFEPNATTSAKRRDSTDDGGFAAVPDRPMKNDRLEALPEPPKPRLRRVRRVDDLFLAANGVSMSTYQSQPKGPNDREEEK